LDPAVIVGLAVTLLASIGPALRATRVQPALALGPGARLPESRSSRLAPYVSAAVTLIGHSYGSVVTGLAAPGLSRNVHDIVALGSPGMGVSRAADLHTGARIWAGTARLRARNLIRA